MNVKIWKKLKREAKIQKIIESPPRSSTPSNQRRIGSVSLEDGMLHGPSTQNFFSGLLTRVVVETTVLRPPSLDMVDRVNLSLCVALPLILPSRATKSGGLRSLNNCCNSDCPNLMGQKTVLNSCWLTISTILKMDMSSAIDDTSKRIDLSSWLLPDANCPMPFVRGLRIVPAYLIHTTQATAVWF